MHYQPTPEDETRAGEELTNLFKADDAAALERGRAVYANFCIQCHGPNGEGDGLVPARGYPPPPPWSAEKTRLLKDGTLFHVISYGRHNMPALQNKLSQEDRWRLVLHIRDLQRRAVQAAEQAAAKGDGNNEKNGKNEAAGPTSPPPSP